MIHPPSFDPSWFLYFVDDSRKLCQRWMFWLSPLSRWRIERYCVDVWVKVPDLTGLINYSVVRRIRPTIWNRSSHERQKERVRNNERRPYLCVRNHTRDGNKAQERNSTTYMSHAGPKNVAALPGYGLSVFDWLRNEYMCLGHIAGSFIPLPSEFFAAALHRKFSRS